MGASVAKLQVSYLNSKLLGAVRRNDAQETEYYVRAGADPNAFTDDTEVQEQYLNLRLRRAVMQHDAQETDYYLRAGADPNATTATDRPRTWKEELPPILLLLNFILLVGILLLINFIFLIGILPLGILPLVGILPLLEFDRVFRRASTLPAVVRIHWRC